MCQLLQLQKSFASKGCHFISSPQDKIHATTATRKKTAKTDMTLKEKGTNYANNSTKLQPNAVADALPESK